MSEPTTEFLREAWLELRNGANEASLNYVRGAIDFARETGLITADESELWVRRIGTCPGHDDESGRDWCAYCGQMPRALKGTNHGT